MASSGSFDAIVLDLLLPGVNGYDVVRALRERRVWTPVVVLTGKAGECDEADALDLGADDFLTKPFSMVALVWGACVCAGPYVAAPPPAGSARRGTAELGGLARRSAHGDAESHGSP
ncbi:response regulator transcription factor [Nonomuraea sp. NPDC050556]|uniref:response regulator transcription factor n=1 Tax=Nonomuraea sp. NPDC050556 TaxID=3364369 RepID=UPI00378BEA1C